MGHIRLNRLPRTRRWQDVIALLNNPDSSSKDIFHKTLYAAELGLKVAAKDEGLIRAFWLLSRVVNAAGGRDFPEKLKDMGLNVSDAPSVFDVAGAFSEYIDNYVTKVGRRSDISAMASSSALECLTVMCSNGTANLFEISPEDARTSLNKLSTKSNFSKLGHEFFARFVYRYISYLLSRELSNYVGPGKKLPDIKSHTEFNDALNLFCRQATRIIDEFAGGWYSKTVYEGMLTFDKTAGFIHVAFKKLCAEFRRGGGAKE
jgi:hypothetical protein